MSILKFQSTHLHEVWLRDVILHKKGNVSIHTPTWGVTPKVKCTLDLSEVSIHTPTWGVTLSLRDNIWSVTFQSTHLHEVWLFVSVRWYCSCEVSIHTPTWGVTFLREYEAWLRQVSIHTPTWGVTIEGKQYVDTTVFQSTHLHEVWLLIVWTIRLIRCFNPHTYMRCDLRGRRQQGDRHVSIHTPTWGVTGFSVRCQNQNDVSIHTPTWGVTYVLFLWHTSVWSFQSTHLHEVWPLKQRRRQESTSFNPHTYMRCDPIYPFLFWFFPGFNPHTYMRCDHRRGKTRQRMEVSIHTPTWGVTSVYTRTISKKLFQSTHLHEVWHLATEQVFKSEVSIHTPTWGVTLYVQTKDSDT